MKKNNSLYLLFIFFVGTQLILAQTEEKIRFKKNTSYIYFYQKGVKQDTILKGKGDVFYLIVPDSLKPFLSIQVENAQFLKTDNDSLVRLNYIKGMNYESVFLPEESNTGIKSSNHYYEFKTMVNGVSSQNPKLIEIKFIDKREKTVLLKNEFYFDSKK